MTLVVPLVVCAWIVVVVVGVKEGRGEEGALYVAVVVVVVWLGW
jgi:hypothetical protein